MIAIASIVMLDLHLKTLINLEDQQLSNKMWFVPLLYEMTWVEYMLVICLNTNRNPEHCFGQTASQLQVNAHFLCTLTVQHEELKYCTPLPIFSIHLEGAVQMCSVSLLWSLMFLRHSQRKFQIRIVI